MVVVGIYAADGHAGIAGKELTHECCWRYRGLNAGFEDRVAALRVCRSTLNVIPQAQVDGQPPRHPPIVLREESPVPIVCVRVVGRVLTVSIRMSDQEVRHGNVSLHVGSLCRSSIGYRRVCIGEDAVVVQ